MTALSTLRFKIHGLLLTLLTKIIRPVPIALAHLSRTPKPTPDLIENVLININSTTDHKIKLRIYNPFSTTNYCRYTATETGHTVIDVAYRLAPEHSFPAALEDIAAVVSHVRSQPDRYDSIRISIGGFSAGGNLATSVAVNYFPPGTFKNFITFYPVLDTSIPAPTKIANMPAEASGRPKYGGMGSVPALAMRFFQACYVSSPKVELAEKGLSFRPVMRI
ncbi:Alpha/Beta hydrolase protein [Aspergillus pseudoustus]|uniref:Alpha/Beta hydrolase protein n=1 Tax=Aspergillus pseudoustus TaxID=1810923 RepID=A0ABR4JPF7_9EURO